MGHWGGYQTRFNTFESARPAFRAATNPYPGRAERALNGDDRLSSTTITYLNPWASDEVARNVALHFGPERCFCAEKHNKNNDEARRETLQLFKLGLTLTLIGAAVVSGIR